MLTKAFRRRRRTGEALFLIVILMVVIVGMVAFSVDVGRMFLVRAQLQTAVDTGAVAAGLTLKQNPNNVDGAVGAAKEFVRLNRVGWLVTIPEDAIQVEAGTWDSTTRTFSTSVTTPDAVRVSATQENEPLIFANVFGAATFRVPREAIASRGGGKMDIMMVLDLSGSMGSHGRIEALRAAAPTFVDVIQQVGDDDRIGVMGYGALIGSYDPVERGHNGTIYGQPVSLFPPESDWAGVLEADLTPDFETLRTTVLDNATLIANKYNGWTPIGAAIRDTAHYLDANARTGVTRSMVLMSDGHANKPTDDGPGYARSMAGYANSLNIKVYTISLGDAADNALMEEIASATGGKHFDAAGSDQAELEQALARAFREVANTIKRVQLVK